MSEKIGFIGVGKMGGGMAACLIKAGFSVTVCDVSPAATASLQADGATVVATPKEVADAAVIVFACLPSPKVSEEVAAQVAQGQGIRVYIETSTIGTDCMKSLQAALAPARIALLDAPISGGPEAASAGTLSTIISGAQADYARVSPAIDSFAKHVFFLAGEPGQAQIAKLINNMLSMTGRAATFEGMVMGMRVGIDPKLLADFINVSTGRNLATFDDFPTRLLHVFETGGKKSIGVKDTELYLREAERLQVPVWSTPNVLNLFIEGQTYNAATPEKSRLGAWVERLKAIRKAQK